MLVPLALGVEVMRSFVVGQSGTGPSPNLYFQSFGPVTFHWGTLWYQVQFAQLPRNSMKQCNYQQASFPLVRGSMTEYWRGTGTGILWLSTLIWLYQPVKVTSLSHVRLFATPPWTVAYQASPSMGISRQEYWSGVPLPSLRIGLKTILISKKFSFKCC